MTITLITPSETKALRLESYIIPARQMIWIGAHNEKVYNTIHVDTPDTFLCTITYQSDTDTWLLTPGQIRTECSRGIKSNRAKACTMCRGCCGYIRTANPDYSLRTPQSQVLLNGEVVSPDGCLIKEGDTLSFKTLPIH